MKTTKIIFAILLKLWPFNPLKKLTLIFLKKFKKISLKIRDDFWFEGIFEVKYFSSKFNIWASEKDKSSLSIFWDNGLENGWDAKSIEIWGLLAKKSEVVFDIGSNIGLYSIAAKTINENCNVFAFEPSKRMFNHLKKNVQINKLDIHLSPAALSNFDGEVDFYDLNVPTAVASLKHNNNLKENIHSINYKVNVKTLKSFVLQQKLKKIDLISIDVEMNEPEVLEGMEDLIVSFRPNFIIEILNREIAEKVEVFFENLGYVFYSIDEQKGLKFERNLYSCNFSDRNHSFNFLICSPVTIEYLRKNGIFFLD